MTRRILLALAGLALSGCVATPPSPPATILPSYSFSLGANYNDIAGVLGPSPRGPRHDRHSNLTEVVYSFPFPAVTADTRLADGTVRSEAASRIHLFFDGDGRLVQMTHRPNPYYATMTDMPVHRATVAPRLLGRDGSVSPADIAR